MNIEFFYKQHGPAGAVDNSLADQIQYDQCKDLQVGKNNSKYKCSMDGRELEWIVVEEDMGVLVDKDQHFQQHINKTVKKGNKIAGIITHYIEYTN